MGQNKHNKWQARLSRAKVALEALEAERQDLFAAWGGDPRHRTGPVTHDPPGYYIWWVARGRAASLEAAIQGQEDLIKKLEALAGMGGEGNV